MTENENLTPDPFPKKEGGQGGSENLTPDPFPKKEGGQVVSLTRFAILSIIAAILTLGMKTLAYFLTGSVGILSDAMESCINLIAALTAYLSLHYASRPVDANHTYGHEKIEFFASGLEGMLIFIAGIGIIYVAVGRLQVPPQLDLDDLGLGTLIAAAASIVNLVVARIILAAARKHDSIVLEADGRHLMTDVWTSAGVLAGLGAVYATKVTILDPIIALLVGVNIIWVAYRLMVRSFNGLMDHALPVAELEAIRQAIRAHLPAGADFHAIRSRQAGAHRFVDFHLLVPGDTSVQQAHESGEAIERALLTVLPHLEVTIHIEPIEAEASWHDNALVGLEPEQPG